MLTKNQACYDASAEKFINFDAENKTLIDVLLDRNYQVQLRYRDTVDKRKLYFVQVINFRNFWYKKDDCGEFTTLFGEKCTKTFSYGEAEFEKDINNDYRFMLDYLDKIFKPLEEKDVAILYYDIETNKSIDIKNADKEIISIAFYSTIFNKHYAYYLKKEKDITNDANFLNKGIVVKCFESEVVMLSEFLRVLKVHDLIFGFNSNFFDDIYFINRCRNLKVPDIVGYFKDTFIKESVYEDRFMAMMMEKGSPVKSEINFIDAKPIVSKLFQRGNFVNKPSRYSLDEIGKILNLEQQKMHLTEGPSTLWEKDKIEELLEYNVQDVVALMAIMEKMKVIDMILTRKNLFKINFADIFKNSKVIDYLILSKYKDIVFPSVNYSQTMSADFEGAVVLEPKGGLYKNVCVADFNSMYPNIIMGFNISPETLVDKDKHIFRQDKLGLLGDILKFMLAQRYEYKRLAAEALKNNDSISYDVYKMTEHQIKDTINSVYGVFAYKFFRLYDVNIASSITYYGRQLITSVADYVAKEEHDFEVLGGDSVAGECCTVVKDDNNVYTYNFNELFEIYSKKYKIHFIRGKEVIFPQNLSTLSFNYETKKNEWKKILRIIKHKTNKKLYCMQAINSCPIVTEDHSLFSNGKLVTVKDFKTDKKYLDSIKLDILKENDFELTNSVKKIDLSLFVDEYQKYIKDYNLMHNKVTRDYEITFDAKFIYFSVKGITKRHSKFNKDIYYTKLPRYIQLTKDFAAIVGSYMSEGSISGSVVRLVCGLDSKWNHDIFKSASAVFGSNNVKKMKCKDNSTIVTLKSCYFLAAVFKSLCGKNSENKQLPNFILDTNKEFIREILINYQKGDGVREWITADMSRGVCGGKSRKLTSQISFLIKHVFKTHTHSKCCYRNDKQCYLFKWNKPDFSKQRWSNTYNRKFEFNSKYDSVFDLEVEDNHNFVDIFGDVILHNTDSLFIHDKTEDADVISKMLSLEVRLNAFLKKRWFNEVIDFNFKMEAETIFSFLILPGAKKTYIGLTKLLKGAKKDDEMYAKGFSLIRKDTPSGLKPSLQKFFLNFLHNVSKDDYVAIKKDLKEMKEHWKTLGYNEFLIVKQINKEVSEYKVVPQHVKALLYSNKHLNTDFSRANYKGGLLFCKIKSGKYPQAECLMLDGETTLPKEMSVNLDKYFDLFVKNKIILLNAKFKDLLFSENKSLLEYVK